VAARHRNAIFLVVALLAHAELIALLPHSRAGRVIASRDSKEDTVWIEETKALTDRSAPTDGTMGMVATRAHHAFTITTTTNGNVETTTIPETAAPETDQTSESSALSSLLVAQDIGLSGSGSYRIDVARAQPSPQEIANQQANREIMDPIRAHELANGDLTSGPVVQEIEHTTRSLAGAPYEGRAVLAVRVDELGLVLSVGVDESSGDAHAWSEVATQVLNALAQKRLHMRQGAKGVAMRIEVTAKVVLPSGAHSPLHVGSPALDALSRMTKGEFDKAPDNGMGTVPIVGGTFDLSDIGAHPVRVASAHVVSQTVQ
jgi:hypothetical protein